MYNESIGGFGGVGEGKFRTERTKTGRCTNTYCQQGMENRVWAIFRYATVVRGKRQNTWLGLFLLFSGCELRNTPRDTHNPSPPHRFQHDPQSSTLWVSSVTILPSGVSFRGALNSGGYTRNAPNSGRDLARDRRGSTYNEREGRGYTVTRQHTSWCGETH